MATIQHGHLHPRAPRHAYTADTGPCPSPAPCPAPRGVSWVLAAASHSPTANPNSCVPQDALSSKGFGTDLPLVNSQVEEHNIFHNEVMAIGPHITKEGSKVSSPVPLPAGPQGRPWPKLLMKARASHHPSCCSPEQGGRPDPCLASEQSIVH